MTDKEIEVRLKCLELSRSVAEAKNFYDFVYKYEGPFVFDGSKGRLIPEPYPK